MDRNVFALFAELVSYPGDFLAERAGEGETLLASFRPAAAAALQSFAAHARKGGTDAMQELYTATFDLHPVCAPYLGHHLCGEDPRRGLFLLKLKEIYRTNGFDPGRELPDHLAEVLRFLAEAPKTEERSALVRDGLAPTLEKMAEAFAGKENPYGRLIEALRICIDPSAAAGTPRPDKEVAHG